MPDKEHEKYFNDNPQGNHSAPSSETKYRLDKQDELNKEILDKLEGVRIINVEQVGVLSRIEAQTIKTNGRVTKLETAEEDRCIAEAKLKGQFTVIKWIVGALGATIVLPAMSTIVSKFVETVWAK